jgi:hypothetical protein
MFYNYAKKFIDNQLVMKSTLSCLPDEDENSPYKALIIS